MVLSIVHTVYKIIRYVCLPLMYLWNFESYKVRIKTEGHTQLTLKTARVVPPEDGHLTPETCRSSRRNKVFVKV
jgi:hypothetical protein